MVIQFTSRWRHNGRDCVSNHQPHDCLLNRLFGRRSKKTSKLRVTGLCAGNSPVTGEFPTQMASNTENVSILWRHHDLIIWMRHQALPRVLRISGIRWSDIDIDLDVTLSRSCAQMTTKLASWQLGFLCSSKCSVTVIAIYWEIIQESWACLI